MENIKIEYYVLNDNMSDEEYNNPPCKTFEITEAMIIELIENNVKLSGLKGDYIDSQNVYLTK